MSTLPEALSAYRGTIPVILRREAKGPWLDPGTDDAAVLAPLLRLAHLTHHSPRPSMSAYGGAPTCHWGGARMTNTSSKETVPSETTGNDAWDRIVKVTCHNNCSNQLACVLNAYVRDGAVVRVEQSARYPSPNDADVPDPHPRGCQKGMATPHRLADPTRLSFPLKRAGARGEGKWQRISWEQALTEIADTVLDVLASDGPDTIIRPLGPGGMVSVEASSFESLLGALGAVTLNPASETGDENSGAAIVFGQPFISCSATNWYYADIVLVWGGNPACTNVSNYHYITEARYHGTRVITLSPDYSPSALPADQWVPVNIGSDATLALSLAHVIIRDRLYKPEFIREQTDLPLLVRTDTKRFLRQRDLRAGGRDDTFYFWDSVTSALAEAPRHTLALGHLTPALEGEYDVATVEGRARVKPVFQLLKEHLEGYSPGKASLVTGVAPSVTEDLARQIATAKGVVNIPTFGWGKFYHGDLIERAIITVFGLCGHIGRKGAGYHAFPQIRVDSAVGNASLLGNVVLRVAAAHDPRHAQWRSEGYTDEMILLEYNRAAYHAGVMSGGSFFHYIHSGLLELSAKHNSWDPTLKRPLAAYVQEALDRGWQPMTPKPGKDPRIMFVMGCSFLRSAKPTNPILTTLLPKLKMLVDIDIRMNSTALYADYVLPASGWFEKYTCPLALKPEFPNFFLINQAVEPLGEAKSEWEIGCLLAKRIEERAKARAMLTFRGLDGSERRLDNLYQVATVNGLYADDDNEAVCRDFYFNATNLERITWEELKEQGFVPCTGVGLTAWSIGNACDIVPGEPVVPLTWHVEKKQPYPTLTRRMQHYVDQDLYVELGQALPTQGVDPRAGGDYPLRLTGGHTRWSVHSNQVDDALILRLQRGEPTIWLSRQDARARAITDGDRVEVSNDVGRFAVQSVVSPAVRPGQAIMYHAWENYQFLGRRHFKSVMASPLNPVELAGGYFHIAPGPACFYPGLSDRDTRIEVRKADQA
ncbi:MAG: molybdopterin-dependent oxidoreductase [Chloroflexi bacterium]|nr:molybdopterin-dependent oxidoreductase [Chloroflexota bacterium]